MAIRINPCFGCILRPGCDLRAEWTAKLSGLGLRSAWFDCDRLAKELRIGRRITVLAPVATDYDRYGDMTVERREVKATITAIKVNHRFSCVVDPGQIDVEDLVMESADVNKIRFWSYKRHARVHRFLEEPDAKVCKYGNLKLPSGACDFREDKRSGCWCESDAENERICAEFIA